MPKRLFIQPVRPAAHIEIDFAIYGPVEYPFLFVPVLHMRCLVCKTQFPSMDFELKFGKRTCPHCRAQVPENMWQRIWNFVREGA